MFYHRHIMQPKLIHLLFLFFNSVRSVMHKYLEKNGDVTFDKIFNQKLGK